MKSLSTKKIVYMSFLIALSIVFTRLLSIRIPLYGVEGIRIGFGGLPMIFAGITMGPLAGGIVGALSDLIGYWINPMGGYMPHFTVTAFMTGFLPGLVYIYFFKSRKSFWTLAAAVAAGQIPTSMTLVPFMIHFLFGAPLMPLLVPRLIGEPINIFIYAYLLKLLLEYDFIDLPEQINSYS